MKLLTSTRRRGHGFGFRAHHQPPDKWPTALQAWLGRGYLNP
jgi:hypothetical protein